MSVLILIRFTCTLTSSSSNNNSLLLVPPDTRETFARRALRLPLLWLITAKRAPATCIHANEFLVPIHAVRGVWLLRRYFSTPKHAPQVMRMYALAQSEDSWQTDGND